MYASPKRSTLISGLLHAGVIALILTATGVRIPPVTPQHTFIFTPTDIHEYIPPARLTSDGGGGGGAGSDRPASRGPLARAGVKQFAPPVAEFRTLLRRALLPMEAAGEVQAPIGPPAEDRWRARRSSSLRLRWRNLKTSTRY